MKVSNNGLVTTLFLTIITAQACKEQAPVSNVIVTTFAGSTAGYADGNGTQAKFNSPTGLTVDASGNVYVADLLNSKIRKITPDGTVSTIAGTTAGYLDGAGADAKFNKPVDVALDVNGNIIVADYSNFKIRKIDSNGIVTTVAGSTQGHADGPALSAMFYYPSALAIGQDGVIYVAEPDHLIRKIIPNGTVSTLAGNTINGYIDGPGINAEFDLPSGLAVDANNNVYVADYHNNTIRKIDKFGVVSSFVGGANEFGVSNGTVSSTLFEGPTGVAIDQIGNFIVSEIGNSTGAGYSRIRKVSSSGTVTTLTGSDKGYVDGTGGSAKFDYPNDVAIDANGNIYVADEFNHVIRKIVVKP